MDACAEAMTFFHNQLLNPSTEEAREAKSYLLERGISAQNISKFNVGFAGNGLVQIISFSDGNYLDNSGSLHFELYEMGGSITWSTGDTSYHTMVLLKYTNNYCKNLKAKQL